jgi:hypothetical protein
VRALDQAVSDAVDHRGVDLWRHAWEDEDLDVFLVNHNGSFRSITSRGAVIVPPVRSSSRIAFRIAGSGGASTLGLAEPEPAPHHLVVLAEERRGERGARREARIADGGPGEANGAERRVLDAVDETEMRDLR